jgi:anti-sigma B factor antagonist
MAALTLDQEARDGVYILRAHGRLTLGEGASVLRDTVRSFVSREPASIILDMTDVGYVDSAGIGELVSAYTSITSQGGRFVLAGLQKRVSDLLQITKLYSVFNVYENANLALADMGKRAAP